MKTSRLLSILFVLLAGTLHAQNINWKSFNAEQKHLINVNAGWDYATSLGLGYAYKINMKMPLAINGQRSLPAGQDTGDDLKAKFGGQLRVVESRNFVATLVVNGIFRQYHSDLVKMQNYGSEFTGIAGYYKSHWFAAAAFGFDKAIATRLFNSETMKQYYPGARNGWYVPTGGKFHYGIQAGYSFRFMDVTLNAGQITDQYFSQSVVVPFYAQLGLNARF